MSGVAGNPSVNGGEDVKSSAERARQTPLHAVHERLGAKEVMVAPRRSCTACSGVCLARSADDLTSSPPLTEGFPATPLMRRLGGFLLHRPVPALLLGSPGLRRHLTCPPARRPRCSSQRLRRGHGPSRTRGMTSDVFGAASGHLSPRRLNTPEKWVRTGRSSGIPG